jgi:hypothetical protein
MAGDVDSRGHGTDTQHDLNDAPYTKHLLSHAHPEVHSPLPTVSFAPRLSLAVTSCADCFEAPPPNNSSPLHRSPPPRLAKNPQTKLVRHKKEIHFPRNHVLRTTRNRSKTRFDGVGCRTSDCNTGSSITEFGSCANNDDVNPAYLRFDE